MSRSPARNGTAPLRAVTFDFWSTLFDGAITPERAAERMARLHRALARAGYDCTPVELERAFRRAMRHVSQEAKESLRDVGPPGRWAVIARELGMAEGRIPYAVVERAYEEITLEPPPPEMPHVRWAVHGLREAGYRLGIICNTGMAGGRTLRQVLERAGLLRAFDVTVWSDEFGWSKPHPEIFAHTLGQLDVTADEALHVGDLEDLDVEGARRAGVHSALYAPLAEEPPATDADVVVYDWRDFPALVAGLKG